MAYLAFNLYVTHCNNNNKYSFSSYGVNIIIIEYLYLQRESYSIQYNMCVLKNIFTVLYTYFVVVEHILLHSPLTKQPLKDN